MKSARENSLLLIITILVLFPFLSVAQSNSIQIDLGVDGCNNNGSCESSLGENILNCPVDCAAVSGGGSGSIPQNIYLYNLIIQPDLTTATISWTSSISTISNIKWGETAEVKEGTLSSVVFARDHKMQLINLKPGTMYYFTIESRDVNGRININQPTYFFTKFLKDTTFPLNPRNVKTSADISGITISWQNPPDNNFSYVRIMRHEDRFRGSPFIGKLIYEGKNEKFLDKNVLEGKKYFYVLFSKDTKGNYSSGVAISEIAYSVKKTPTPPPIIIEEEPSVPALTENFFVHQYNQQVEQLTKTKPVEIVSDKSTVVDINTKTFTDDLIKVTNENGDIVGQYLFSFNKDSGRYQGVISPFEKEGNYNIKIYRYVDNVPTLISEGSVKVKANSTQKTEQLNNKNYLQSYIFNHLDLIFIIISIIILILAIFLLRNRTKKSTK